MSAQSIAKAAQGYVANLFMSAAGRALSKALESPDDWTCGKHEITHQPSGLAFWRCNGSFFFDGSWIDSTPPCLGLIERHWLYFKARKIRAKYVPPQKKSDQVAARFEKARAK